MEASEMRLSPFLWANELKSVPRNIDEVNDEKFWSLVDQAEGSCDKFVAKVLLSTFSDTLEDNGTQEAVIRALNSADARVRCEALLEELPRLKSEAPEWASILIYAEVKFHQSELLEVARRGTAKDRSLLQEFLWKMAKEAELDGAPDLCSPVARSLGSASE